MRRPVLALEFDDGATPPGNKLLFTKGALPVRSPQQLSDILDTIHDTDDTGGPNRCGSGDDPIEA